MEKKDEIILQSDKTEIIQPENSKSENVSPNCSNKKRKFYEAFPETKNCGDNLGKRILTDQNYETEIKVIETKNIEISPQKDEEICKLKMFKKIKGTYSNENSESKFENTENNIPSNSYIHDITNKDIFVDINNFISSLCLCQTCKTLYKSYQVEFLGMPEFLEDWDKRELIEEVLNKEAGEESPDNQNLISDINNSNIFGMSKIKSLPIEKVRKKIYIKFNF